MKSFFKSKEILPGVYAILGEAVARFLILGDTHALLFDTGYGFEDIHAYVQTLTDKPLYVVNSHGHIDHAGGNIFFDFPIYMNPLDIPVYKRHQSKEFRKIGYNVLYKLQRKLLFGHKLIPKGYDADKYYHAPLFEKFVETYEGMRFDLGGVSLSVVDIPGHTQGSIGLYCPEKRLFFSGDGINSGTWLFTPESCKLSVYIDSLLKVNQLAFDYLITGHSGKLFKKLELENYIDVAQNLDFENGKKQKPAAYTPDIYHRRCYSKNARSNKNKAALEISAAQLE